MRNIVIDGHEVAPGEELQINAVIGRLPTRTPINIPVFVNRAVEDGPVLLIMAGVHGDETNGIEIVRRFLKNKYNKPTRGTIIAIPVYNVYGFINHSRGLPDGKDLNRSFPGSQSGSLASRVAHFLTTQIIPVIDYGLDFHTGGKSHNNYPQIRAYFESEADTELAQIFGAPFIIHSGFRDKSLRKSAAKAGKQILVYEGGETLRLRKHVIDSGVNGILRVMKHLGMRDEAPEIIHKPIFIENSSWVRAKYAGLHHSLVRNGAKVEKKQLIGLITDPYGQFEKQIKSPMDGYVIGINNYPVVNMGDALLHIGSAK
ncbi:succinylglutamate desuccinylase/aspartoacylase family protein [Fulvivirga sp. RKSG066]|uniref:succinylglutamate desuccinylase/aspartoacylase family protein n=1 Tax=Fulvivirga aurantia TaxID=2529383 RepID=UPI0012BCD5F8|nr:succinylglutamate desuccinylase/aspartoacylase family protein [Fulvivirga aurantia]MTI19899.1 succinylglutamate desuccinylase/aspartoacylase family protein [Fulvivirga aurantia]